MSSYKNATGKSGTAKPNTNANGIIDGASKPSVDPEAVIGKPPAADRAESAPANEAATEREDS